MEASEIFLWNLEEYRLAYPQYAEWIDAVKTENGAERKSIGQMLYEMSRPGIELPIPPRSPARIPDFE